MFDARRQSGLLLAGPISRSIVGATAAAVGLSVSQAYRLLGRLREKPLTQSLVVGKAGPRKGTRLLHPGWPVISRLTDTISPGRSRFYRSQMLA